MEVIQNILIVILAGYMTVDQNGPVVLSWFSVFVGMISGLIMGDMNTGLMIGGTFQLMSLGVAALGGASAPNYGLATIIGTFIAVRTGTGVDAAIAVGLPVGLLAIQLEVVVRIILNFVAHKMQTDNNEGKWRDVYIKVIDNVCSTNDMDIEDIKNLLGVEYSVNEYPYDEKSSLGLNVVEYIFETDDEMFMVQYIKEKDKIFNVFYNDKNTNTINTVVDNKLIDEKKNLHTGICTYVEDFDKQRELLDY